MIITPTLHFNGKCEEAIDLYTRAFGCKVKSLRYSGDTDEKRVMHSEIIFGDQIIRMSDGLSSDNNPVRAIFLAVSLDTKEEVENARDVLCEGGGEVTEAFESTPYSSCMGSIMDPYGFRWRIMTEQADR